MWWMPWRALVHYAVDDVARALSIRPWDAAKSAKAAEERRELTATLAEQRRG